MTGVQEAADAEWPGIGNVFTDRLGRLVFHGREAKWDPATIATEAGDDAWDWHHWYAGDGHEVSVAVGPMAQIRQFAYNLGRSKIINYAVASPIYKQVTGGGAPPDDTDLASQVVKDDTSIEKYGIKTWSKQDLLTMSGIPSTSSTALQETKRFAQYYVDNYAQPHRRITQLGFRTLPPSDSRAPDLWDLLCKVDIADQIDVTVNAPGGGLFLAEPFFIEGIHETVEGRLRVGAVGAAESYDNVTLTLDVSPKAYFDTPFPEPGS
jgi:hypothetical protein